MTTVILLGVFFLSYFGSNIFSKKSSILVAGSPGGYGLFLLANSVIACLFFWLSNGFLLQINLRTLYYSVIFAAVVFATLILGLYVYRFVSVAGVTIFRNAGSLILGAGMGSLLFQETLKFVDYIRILLLIGAIVLFAIGFRDHFRKGSIKGFGALILLTLANSAAVIVQKYYAIDPQVVDENSFFFFTNVILILCALLWLVLGKKKITFAKEKQKKIAFPMAYVCNTICSNIGSQTTVLLLQTMALSLYTPLSIALGIISGVGTSLVFREKVDLWVLSAAALSVVAAII